MLQYNHVKLGYVRISQVKYVEVQICQDSIGLGLDMLGVF